MSRNFAENCYHWGSRQFFAVLNNSYGQMWINVSIGLNSLDFKLLKIIKCKFCQWNSCAVNVWARQPRRTTAPYLYIRGTCSATAECRSTSCRGSSVMFHSQNVIFAQKYRHRRHHTDHSQCIKLDRWCGSCLEWEMFELYLFIVWWGTAPLLNLERPLKPQSLNVHFGSVCICLF